MSREQRRGPKAWLEEVRSEYWDRMGRGVEEEPEEQGVMHVLFDVAGKRFAVEACLCKGVVRRPDVSQLPMVPEHILGVTSVRGEVVSVTDPVRHLSLPKPDARKEGHLLLVADGGVKTALWVDRVIDVVPLLASTVVPVEHVWEGVPDGILKGEVSGTPKIYVLDGCQLVATSAVLAGADHSF